MLLRVITWEFAAAVHHSVCRVVEPHAVMEDPLEVAAYASAGKELGIMSPTYLFHTAQACEILRPGDRVLDLACGPGTQLSQLARLNVDTEFVGIDLSSEMLRIARKSLDEQGLRNVTLLEGDITDLSAFEDRSFGAVVSSMSLHHLPEFSMLNTTLSEVSRVLKENGGLYLADFGRLKSEKSMHAFAHRDAEIQAEVFTRDYFNSLKAAFSVAEFRTSVQRSVPGARVFRMRPIPFMMVAKSKPRRVATSQILLQLKDIRDSLSPQSRADLSNMIRCFRFGGLRTRLLR